MIVSVFLDPDDLRFTQDHLIAANRGKRLAHGVLGGRIGNQDHWHRLARAAGDIAAMRRLAAVTLHDRLERDVLLRQSLGDGRGGARFVDRKEADVVAAFVTLHRRLLAGGQPRRRPAERRRAHATGDVTDIGDDGRRRRQATCARADQRDRRDCVDVDGDGVCHAHHLGDRGVLRDHGRMHALLYALVGLYRDAQQLHAVAELGGPFEVFGRDRRNAFHVDGALIDLGAESEARQDRELLRSIMALDVEGWIGLGVTEPLRLLQAVRERELLLFHARQDVVAGAVEDSIDARERIAGQTLAQRFHDRDGAADRGLEIERHMVLLGNGRQRDAVAGKQRLVGGDNRFFRGERGRDRGLGRVALPADQLHEDVDLAIARERYRVGDPTQFLVTDVALLAARARTNCDDLDRATATSGECVALALDEAGDARADRAQAGNTEFQWSGHRRPAWKRSI